MTVVDVTQMLVELQDVTSMLDRAERTLRRSGQAQQLFRVETDQVFCSVQAKALRQRLCAFEAANDEAVPA